MSTRKHSAAGGARGGGAPGKASAALAKGYGVKKLPGVAVLSYGTGAKAAKNAQAFGGDEVRR